ncbi:MAG TPA: hypothetical protein VGQ42_12535 [Candidatus Dormibacteraeota bacterium]|nr:hypothetical protein [Candidatus Dormibacteraeota bacterium]
MSDDAPRSAQGNRPDQRRGRGAPVWWDMLQRSDLPDDPDALDMVTRVRGWDASAPRPHEDAHRSRLAVAVSIVSAVLVALSVAIGVWVATSTSQHTSGLTLAVIVAVPVVLIAVSVLTSFAGRRQR